MAELMVVYGLPHNVFSGRSPKDVIKRHIKRIKKGKVGKFYIWFGCIITSERYSMVIKWDWKLHFNYFGVLGLSCLFRCLPSSLYNIRWVEELDK